MNQASPLVYIVLLNWHGWQDTLECLETLLRLSYPRYRVAVVDNASGDESLERLEGWAVRNGLCLNRYRWQAAEGLLEMVEQGAPRASGFAGLDLIASSQNTGFCLGNNIGLHLGAQLGAAYFLVLNNDTLAEPGVLEPLVEAAKDNPNTALMSPLICYAGDQDRIWWGGGSFGKMLAPSYRHQGSPRSLLYGQPPEDSDWASGCALFIPRAVYDRFGGFDERFFIWCDEWDLSLRLRRAGLGIKIVPAGVVYHKVGRALGFVSPLTFYYGTRNMLILRRRYLSVLGWVAALLATVPWKALQALRLSLAQKDPSYLLAFWDILCGIPGYGGGLWKRQRP